MSTCVYSFVLAVLEPTGIERVSKRVLCVCACIGHSSLVTVKCLIKGITMPGTRLRLDCKNFKRPMITTCISSAYLIAIKHTSTICPEISIAVTRTRAGLEHFTFQRPIYAL